MNFFDLHCDTPYLSEKTGQSVSDGDLAVTLKKGGAFDRWCQVCAVWIPDGCDDPRGRYERIKNSFLAQTAVKTTASGLDSTPAFLLSLEGGSLIAGPDDVDRLYADGVRVITLTWNGGNALAGGCHSSDGLSRLGAVVIERMNALSMALDVSHLNDKSFWDALPLADRVIATHTACRSVHGVSRNLTDRQIRAVAEKGGTVGLCFYPRFLGTEDVYRDFAVQLDRLISVAGRDAAAVGSDFDGADMAPALDSLDKVPLLYAWLSQHGFSAAVLDDVFYGNAYRYFKDLLK